MSGGPQEIFAMWKMDMQTDNDNSTTAIIRADYRSAYQKMT